MARPVTLAIVFFVALNLLSGVMLSQGIAGAVGLDANVGENDAVNEQVDDRTIQGGTGTGNTLVDLRNVIGSQLSQLFGVIFPGLRMLERAGMPKWITGGILGPLFSILTLILGLAYFRGFDL